MSKSVMLLVDVPDDVYDNACKVKENTNATIEAILSVATEHAMKSIAKNVKGLLKLRRKKHEQTHRSVGKENENT